MKKIAGILICIALAFTLAGCSWKIPETVSVKTNADYNFSLGNFEKDFSENLSVSKMIGDLQLPNNGKVYDYWPNKKGDTQSFLMYMPLQEIPIDIGSYFDKGSLADSIKNISFEKEIEVPEVSFSFPVEFNLDDVNKEINKQFVLAGLIQNYNASEFGAILKEVADSITYEKGVLVVTAYEVSLEDISKLNAGTATIQSIANSIATSYYGSVSITSGYQAPLSGYFSNGKAELVIPSSGFDFISDDINIYFTNIPSSSDYGYKPLVFIAKIDTDREYQIKKVSGIGNTISIPSVSFNQKIDSLAALKDSGVEECTIGEGSIDLDFDIPSEWKNVAINYGITMTGGIEATSVSCTASSSSSNNVGSIDLDGKSIKAEEINVSAAVTLTVAGATIDFTKPPAISFDSNITRIETVTVKLSDTSLSVADSQALPDEVFNILKAITLNQCGIEGTYTNTLPGGVDNSGNPINAISLTVSSEFFGLASATKTIEGGKENEELKFLTPVDEEGNPIKRTIKLRKTPAAADEFNAFDFDVQIALPGGDSNKVTVSNVEPGKTYKLGIDVKPKIDWYSVTIDTASIPSQNDKIGTGFNPSTIFDSINDVLGNGFSDNISIPEGKLYLYLSKPNTDKLSSFEGLTGSSIKMYLGDADKNYLPNPKDTATDKKNQISILEESKSINFVQVPELKSIKNEDGSETVIQNISNYTTSLGEPIILSDLFNFETSSTAEGQQLCIDYNISLNTNNGKDGIEILSSDLGLNLDGTSSEEETGADSIGIYAIIELPLSFTVAENTTIDLQNLINKKDSEESEDENKDLFGRSEASGFDEIEKYLEVIEAAKIQYRLDSFPIKTSNNISLNLELCDGDNQTVLAKELPFDTDATEPIEITNDDIKKLLNTYPLKLKTAKITFAGTNGTEISIPRTKKLDVNLQIGITTDGTIELFGGKN